MKIYVAGKLQDRETVAEAIKTLQGAGHEITFDWTDTFAERPFADHPDAALKLANRELQGIVDCDAFVFFAHNSGRTLHMEFGAARALATVRERPLLFVVGGGDYSAWFFDPKVTHHETIDAVVAELADFGKTAKQTAS